MRLIWIIAKDNTATLHNDNCELHINYTSIYWVSSRYIYVSRYQYIVPELIWIKHFAPFNVGG